MAESETLLRLRRALGRIAALRDASSETSLAAETARAALEVLEADAAEAWIPAPEGGFAAAAAAPGADPVFARITEPPAGGAVARAIRSGPFRAGSGEGAEPAGELPAPGVPLPSDGPVCASPLGEPGRECGAVVVRRRSDREEFGPDDPEFLSAVAGIASGARQDLLRRRQLGSRNEQLEHVLQASMALNSSRDLDPLLGLLMDAAVSLTKADAGALVLREDEGQGLYFKASAGGDGDRLRHLSLQWGEGLAGAVAVGGEPIVVEDASSDPRHAARIVTATGIVPRALLCVPLRVKEEAIGAMEVFRTQSGAPFGGEEMSLLQALAAHAAVAIRNAMLYRQAITDELTGLYSFRYFQDALRRETKLAEKHRTSLSLVIVDVDGFKGVNDRHGHNAGDLLLVEVARVLRSCLRDTDIVARYGGDEMLVALRELDKETATTIAERMRRKVEALELPAVQGGTMRVTCSIGIASFPQDTPVRDRLFYLADSALYAAKRGGRNRVCGWSPEVLQGAVDLA